MAKRLRISFTLFSFFFFLFASNLANGQDKSVDFSDSLDHSITIEGKEGWRLVTSPSHNVTFDDLFSNLWVQGIGGSDAPLKEATLFFWDQRSGGKFVPVKEMSHKLETGRGYLLYVFKDNERVNPGVQGSFPKVINIGKNRSSDIVTISVAARDIDESGSINNLEGWNLLGNPYQTSISVTKVLDVLKKVDTDINNHVYVWRPSANNGNGDFKVLNEGKHISPFRAFFIRYIQKDVDGRIVFNRNVLNVDANYNFSDQSILFNEQFKLSLGNGKKYDEYTIRFSSDGKLGEDNYDGYKLFSLKSHSINLFSILGQGTKLAVNVLPPVEQLEGDINIPLRYQLPEKGKYFFRWEKLDKLPDLLNVFLSDNKKGVKIDLRNRKKYSFNYIGSTKGNINTNQQAIELNQTKDVEMKPRFNLILALKKNEEKPAEMANSVALSPNYPNPFRKRTEMSFKLKESGAVTITIWNIVGQKVATIYDNKMMSEGKHYYYWKADPDLPSGIYICKLEAGGTVVIRKMTLIK